jgi:hypothetical protein
MARGKAAENAFLEAPLRPSSANTQSSKSLLIFRDSLSASNAGAALIEGLGAACVLYLANARS